MAWISVLLWLWRKLAAVAPIQPLAWKRLYAAGASLESQKKKRERERMYASGLTSHRPTSVILHPLQKA